MKQRNSTKDIDVLTAQKNEWYEAPSLEILEIQEQQF